MLYAKAGEVLGRKKALLWGLVTSCLCEFVLFCSASAYFFSATMVVLGASLPGAILFPPLLLTEMMDSSHRDSFYFYLQTFACLGSVTSACISYVMFSWRPIVLGSMAAGLLAIVLLQRVKESPRYYAANLSRYQKARAVFQRMAETNRESMFDGTLVGEQMNEYNETNGRVEEKSEIPDQTADKSEILEQSVQPAHDYLGADSANDREKDLERGQRCGFVHLCIYRSCRGKTLRMLIACGIAGVAGGAGVAGIGSFSENLYFDVGARTAAVLAMVVVCGLQTALCGRKCTALVFMLAVAALSGVISAASFIPLQYVPVAYALLTLAGAGLWLVLCLWTLELVPTPVRSLVAGLVLSAAVLGSAVFPTLGAVPKGYMMVAAAAVVGLCMLAGLPETKTKYLQDFIEELIVSTAPVKPAVRPPRRGPGFSPFNEVQD